MRANGPEMAASAMLASLVAQEPRYRNDVSRYRLSPAASARKPREPMPALQPAQSRPAHSVAAAQVFVERLENQARLAGLVFLQAGIELQEPLTQHRYFALARLAI